jgi:hypothetical protein
VWSTKSNVTDPTRYGASSGECSFVATSVGFVAGVDRVVVDEGNAAEDVRAQEAVVAAARQSTISTARLADAFAASVPTFPGLNPLDLPSNRKSSPARGK